MGSYFAMGFRCCASHLERFKGKKFNFNCLRCCQETDMKFIIPTILFVLANLSAACTPPDVIWNRFYPQFRYSYLILANHPCSIDIFFAVQVQNATQPDIDLRHITFTPSGGGDQHLYLSPAGTAVSDFQLQGGVWVHGPIIHAVVSTQVDIDGTRNIFFTERTQQFASLNARFGCHPVTDQWQVEFDLQDGSSTCIKPASGGRYELRYKPVGVSGMWCWPWGNVCGWSCTDVYGYS